MEAVHLPHMICSNKARIWYEMDKKVEKIKGFRLYLLDQVSGLTSRQLNAIPKGYSNNIIWNMGHLVATTQALCYKRAGLPITTDDKYFTPFLPSTKPGIGVSDEDIAVIKKLMISSVDTLQNDVENGIFGNYTRSGRILEVYGMDISNIDDAIEFILYHEGLHTGCIKALKYLV